MWANTPRDLLPDQDLILPLITSAALVNNRMPVEAGIDAIFFDAVCTDDCSTPDGTAHVAKPAGTNWNGEGWDREGQDREGEGWGGCGMERASDGRAPGGRGGTTGEGWGDSAAPGAQQETQCPQAHGAHEPAPASWRSAPRLQHSRGRRALSRQHLQPHSSTLQQAPM